MSIRSALIGWRGYAAALAAGAVLVAGMVTAWKVHGSGQFAAGQAQARLEAAANARQIEAQYRRQEQEMAADYVARLEKVNEETRLSNAERDLAAGAAGSMRDIIAAERTRATKAAARAGLSEQAATRAWDVLAACTREYAALAADADGAIDGLRTEDAWAKAAAGVRLR